MFGGRRLAMANDAIWDGNHYGLPEPLHLLFQLVIQLSYALCSWYAVRCVVSDYTEWYACNSIGHVSDVYVEIPQQV